MTQGVTMAKLIRSIAAVLNHETEHETYRFSRGIGPRRAPRTRRY
jgi:hypothetical protein